MVPGTKPKPTAMKKLAGNPGKRALNKQEPKLPVDIPQPPEILNDAALTEWERVVKELFATGVITLADRAALAAYCMAYSRWLEAEEYLEQHSWTYTTEKGNEIQSPYVGIANQLRMQVVKFATEFGMTPSSRSRVNAVPKDDADQLERSLFGTHVKIKKG